jgi:hypothetical protein
MPDWRQPTTAVITKPVSAQLQYRFQFGFIASFAWEKPGAQQY